MALFAARVRQQIALQEPDERVTLDLRLAAADSVRMRLQGLGQTQMVFADCLSESVHGRLPFRRSSPAVLTGRALKMYSIYILTRSSQGPCTKEYNHSLQPG